MARAEYCRWEIAEGSVGGRLRFRLLNQSYRDHFSNEFGGICINQHCPPKYVPAGPPRTQIESFRGGPMNKDLDFHGDSQISLE